MNDKQFEDMKKQIDDFDWDEHFKKEEVLQKQKDKRLLEFKNNRLNYCMSEMLEYLKEKKYIDNEELSYSEDKCTFTSEEFDMLFQLLCDYAEINEIFINSSDFSFGEQNFVFSYENNIIVGRIAHGQGTMEQLRIDYYEDIKEGITDKDIIFTWDDFINNIKRPGVKDGCEYCEQEVSILASRRWDIYIDKNNKALKINCSYESDNEIELDIKYCPMCGRKL